MWMIRRSAAIAYGDEHDRGRPYADTSMSLIVIVIMSAFIALPSIMKACGTTPEPFGMALIGLSVCIAIMIIIVMAIIRHYAHQVRKTCMTIRYTIPSSPNQDSIIVKDDHTPITSCPQFLSHPYQLIIDDVSSYRQAIDAELIRGLISVPDEPIQILSSVDLSDVPYTKYAIMIRDFAKIRAEQIIHPQSKAMFNRGIANRINRPETKKMTSEAMSVRNTMRHCRIVIQQCYDLLDQLGLKDQSCLAVMQGLDRLVERDVDTIDPRGAEQLSMAVDSLFHELSSWSDDVSSIQSARGHFDDLTAMLEHLRTSTIS
jgi:hypothetical protein